MAWTERRNNHGGGRAGGLTYFILPSIHPFFVRPPFRVRCSLIPYTQIPFPIVDKSNRAMVLDSMVSSPHRWSPSFKKQFARDE
ncbi:hypothetical protein MLD38_029378 [Melastoma candidum]|uniref:Uncharacterized protein n=1 Tax=Melastoma candidum TaxID=119954 RepID=A0ACB9N3K4_9MYRT|nr:hypothetical protein MLD38_029378 [Melastoma candidum]